MGVLIGLLVVIIVVLFTFGLPLLINGSVMLSNFFKGKPAITDNITEAIGDIQITDIPGATNSAQLIVSGTLDHISKIEFYINGDKVKDMDSSSQDSFSAEIGNLKPGDNEVYAIGLIKDSSQKKETSKHNVAYRNQKPKLEISSPADNSTTTHDEISVSGQTDPGVNVQVNDLPVVTDSTGHWQTSVKLNEGDNKIKVDVTDSAGNKDEKTITVKYEKP